MHLGKLYSRFTLTQSLGRNPSARAFLRRVQTVPRKICYQRRTYPSQISTIIFWKIMTDSIGTNKTLKGQKKKQKK